MSFASENEISKIEDNVHRFVLNLASDGSSQLDVRSCEVIGPNYRNRYLFPKHSALEDVLVGEMVDGVHAALDALSSGAEVVSLPSMVVEMPGLSLAKAQIITSKVETKGLNILLRFRLLIGDINRAFRPEVGMDASVSDNNTHIASLVLTDIVMPILDLCAAAEAGQVDRAAQLDGFLRTLQSRADDVRFQAELIKRFVANSKKDGAFQKNLMKPLTLLDYPRLKG